MLQGGFHNFFLHDDGSRVSFWNRLCYSCVSLTSFRLQAPRVRTVVEDRESQVGGGGNRGIALLFFNLVRRWRWVVEATLRPLYPREGHPVPIMQEAGWVAGPDWKGAESIALTGVRSPDRPNHSESSSVLTFFFPVNLHLRILRPHCVLL
jgi:hypothetical protein